MDKNTAKRSEQTRAGYVQGMISFTQVPVGWRGLIAQHPPTPAARSAITFNPK